LDLIGDEMNISERTSINWLKKLGYLCKDVQKGMYIDGHERPDVIEAHEKFLRKMEHYERCNSFIVSMYSCLFIHCSFMSTYDDKTLMRIPPYLGLGEKEHVLVTQDECIFHVNESRRQAWLLEHEQPIKKKGNGRAIHVSDFICETTGFLALSEAHIEEQMKLPPESRLCSFSAQHIIYPGKNHDAWWDLKQLIENVSDAIDIFEYTNAGMVAIFIFDCSSSHEGLAPDALNINNMNLNPGGKQKHLCDTIIPLSNPPPKPGHVDTHGMPQSLVYSLLHPDAKLAGQPKGMRVVLEERVSVWDEYIERLKGRRVVGKCQSCQKSQLKKDAERRIAAAEAMGQEDTLTSHDIADAEGNTDDAASGKMEVAIIATSSN
jgi:hypothetical protein